MSQGKAIAQAGHAYTDALINALDTPNGKSYAKLKPGTKICLDGGTQGKMLRLSDELSELGIPHVKIIDSGHIELPHFDGSDVFTTIGIGPLTRSEAPRVMRRLKLWPDQPKKSREGDAMGP